MSFRARTACKEHQNKTNTGRADLKQTNQNKTKIILWSIFKHFLNKSKISLETQDLTDTPEVFICFLTGGVWESIATVQGLLLSSSVGDAGVGQGEGSWDPSCEGRAGTWPSTLPYTQAAESLGRTLAFLCCQQCHNLWIYPQFENTKMNASQNYWPEILTNLAFLKSCFSMSKWVILPSVPPDKLVFCL